MSQRPSAWIRLANDLKRARTASGLTQRELARRMGRPPPRVSELEGGRRDPRISTVLAAVSALGMDLVVVSAAKARQLRRVSGETPGRAGPMTVLEELSVADEGDDG